MKKVWVALFFAVMWANAVMAVYLVVDISGGPGASSYPVTNLTAVPSGGWSMDYKTTKLVLRRVPRGTFMMGSPVKEFGRCSWEAQHGVTLTRDFYIGVFEVTQKQWERVMGTDPSYSKGDDRPVENVSYDMIRGASRGAGWPACAAVDVDSFIGRLRVKTGISGFDLPTEAQWEYACRAGTTTGLNSGLDLTAWMECANLSTMGRYRLNYDDGRGGYIHGHTGVGSYRPNAWGLYDMHGNVWEWCLDWWKWGDYRRDTAVDPCGDTFAARRILRGGCWRNWAFCCRSAYRFSSPPARARYIIGFRLACSAE